MPEDDEYIEAETHPERKEREARENARSAVDAYSIGAALRDAMQYGGRNQQPDRRCHQDQCEAVAVSRRRAKLPKTLLKGRLELKTEQHLGSENEQSGFVDGCLDLTAEAHASLQRASPEIVAARWAATPMAGGHGIPPWLACASLSANGIQLQYAAERRKRRGSWRSNVHAGSCP
jgi:hypothetical protein